MSDGEAKQTPKAINYDRIPAQIPRQVHPIHTRGTSGSESHHASGGRTRQSMTITARLGAVRQVAVG